VGYEAGGEPPTGFSTPPRVPDEDPERLLMKAHKCMPCQNSSRPDSRAPGYGGQALGLVTERDERMKTYM
jgi:hypothetical protein